MQAFAQHIYFERRRLTLAGALALLAGFALSAHVDGVAYGLPFPIFTGVLYTVSVVSAAAVTTYMLPNLRWLIDCVAASRLVFAIAIVGFQGQQFATSPFTSAVLVVGGAIILQQICGVIDRVTRASVDQTVGVTYMTKVKACLAWLDNNAARSGQVESGI